MFVCTASTSRPVECELELNPLSNEAEQTQEPTEPIQSDVWINPADAGESQLYSEIEDEATALDSVSMPPVYQTASRVYYEGLVASPDTEPQRSLIPILPVYDRLGHRQSDLRGCKAETIAKTPYMMSTDFTQTRRLRNTL